VSLPTSRDVTYVPGSPVLSANLNNLQDLWVATVGAGLAQTIKVNAYKYSTAHKRTVHAFVGQPQVVGDWVVFSNYGMLTNSGAVTTPFFIPLTVEEGEQIVEVSVVVDLVAAADTLTADLFKVSNAFVLSSSIGTDTSNGAGGVDTLLITGLTESVTDASYFVRISPSGTAGIKRVAHAIVKINRP